MDWKDKLSAVWMALLLLLCIAIYLWALITGQPFPEIEGAL